MLKHLLSFMFYLFCVGMSGKVWAQEHVDCSATFSLETGELSLPCVTILSHEQETQRYKVEMQQVTPKEDFRFMVTQAIPNPDIPEEEVPFSIIDEGNKRIYKGFGEGLLAVRDESAFTSLWQELFPTNTYLPPGVEKPVMDFKQEMLIAVFAGTFWSSGVLIRVRKIIEKKDPIRYQTIVSVAVIRPSPESNPSFTDGTTSPYQLIKVKRLHQPILVNTTIEYSPSWPPK